LNEILHGKWCGFPLVRSCVLHKQTFTSGKGVTPQDLESNSDETDFDLSLDDMSEYSTESETENSDTNNVASLS